MGNRGRLKKKPEVINIVKVSLLAGCNELLWGWPSIVFFFLSQVFCIFGVFGYSYHQIKRGVLNAT